MHTLAWNDLAGKQDHRLALRRVPFCPPGLLDRLHIAQPDAVRHVQDVGAGCVALGILTDAGGFAHDDVRVAKRNAVAQLALQPA